MDQKKALSFPLPTQSTRNDNVRATVAGTSRSRGVQEYDDDGLLSLPPPGRRHATQVIPRAHQPSRRSDSSTPSTAPSSQIGSSSRDPQVGAVAVSGIGAHYMYGGDDNTVLIGGDIIGGSGGGTVVAEAITSDDHIAQELREQIRQEVQAEMRNQMVAAEVVSTASQPSTKTVQSSQGNSEDNKSFWEKKQCLIAVMIALLLIAGGTVGALFATGTVGGGNDLQQENTPNEGIVGGDQGTPASPAPTSPNVPQPTLSQGITFTNPQTLQGRTRGDLYGEFVVLSRDGSTMAVGASEGNYVQVFRRTDGSTWSQIGQTITGDGGGDQFGRCVDLNQDGSAVVVGAWNNDGVAEKAGHARVYRFDENGNEWIKVGQTLEGDAQEDRFGWYVSLSDDANTVAVSARLGDSSGGKDAGYVRVFSYTQNQWLQLGSDLEGEAPSDQFGRSLALDASGRRLAVGAVHGGGGTGCVRVYDFSEGTWTRVGNALDGDNVEDWQGTSVALSADGLYLAIGADGTDLNGSNVGIVRVYRLDGCCTWIQHGQNILGESSGDQFGASQISLSNDGTCLAIGANHHDNDTGKGYLYLWNGSQWSLVGAANGGSNGDRFGDSATVSGTCQWVAWGALESSDSGTGYVEIYQLRR